MKITELKKNFRLRPEPEELFTQEIDSRHHRKYLRADEFLTWREYP
jgi:hypothetical protein